MPIPIEEISNDLLDNLAMAYLVKSSSAAGTHEISVLDVKCERRQVRNGSWLETEQACSARFKQTVRDRLRELIIGGRPLPPPNNPEVLVFVVPFNISQNISHIYPPYCNWLVEWQSELLRNEAVSMMESHLLRGEALKLMQMTAQHHLEKFMSLEPFAGGIVPWPCVVAYLE